jgi:hypothetical protein
MTRQDRTRQSRQDRTEQGVTCFTYEHAVADERLSRQDAHAHYHEGRSKVADQLSEPGVTYLAGLFELRSSLKMKMRTRTRRGREGQG